MTTLFEVNRLRKFFPVYRGIFRRHVSDVKAVDNVSYRIVSEEILGLVGESGSGKSTVGRASIRLIEPTAGEVFFEGRNLLAYSQRELRGMRKSLQMIFQDPLASLNPRKTILDIIGEALLYHQLVTTRKEQIERVATILQSIGMSPHALDRYPHQFSGGQQQRISIGRAIALQPKLVICDEAISALDLSVQGQILNLLYDLKQSHQLSYLFISHDLSVVRIFCDRVLVMYKGTIVESGPATEVFDHPKHPYTQLLVSSIPKRYPTKIPKPLPIVKRSESVSTGCPFFSRCPVSKSECQTISPPLKTVGNRSYACIH